MTDTPDKHPFILYLEKLKEDRAALAALRRGLGQPPGSAVEVHRYVVPWLPSRPYPRQEEAYYLVASLFGLHPESAQSGNMGRHYYLASKEEASPDTVERRFTILLSAHADDLPFQLRQAVSYLRAKDIAINWDQLLRDLQAWNHPRRYVQKNWAYGYWGRPASEEEDSEKSDAVSSPAL